MQSLAAFKAIDPRTINEKAPPEVPIPDEALTYRYVGPGRSILGCGFYRGVKPTPLGIRPMLFSTWCRYQHWRRATSCILAAIAALKLWNWTRPVL